MKKFKDKMVIFVIAFVIIFFIAMYPLMWHTGTGVEAMIVAFFAFATGELWAMAKIEIEKNKRKGDE